MKAGQIITAVDIGTTKICVIISQLNEEQKLEIKGVGFSKSEGLRNGIVIDMVKASNSMFSAIKQAEAMTGKKAQNLFLGIAGDHISSHNAIGSISLASSNHPVEITQQHIEDVISNAKNSIQQFATSERKEIIHAIPQYFKVDEQTDIKNPLRMSGFNLSVKVHVVLADSNAKKNIIKCLDLIGYRVEDLYLEPIASSNAVLNSVEKQLGSVLIDIGGGTTDIVVFFKDSIRFSAVIPLGGMNITQDLAVGLQTSPQKAEEIKVSKCSTVQENSETENFIEIEGIGGRPSKRKRLSYVNEIISARMNEILENAFKLITEKYDLTPLTAGITLTGGASLLNQTADIAEQFFNLSAKIGYPDLSRLAGPTEELNSPKYATSVGILYQAYEELIQKNMKTKSLPYINPLKRIIQKIADFFKDYN
jgi:cell division protein FtsA